MRLDLFLVSRQLAVSRTQAQDLIKAGFVVQDDGGGDKVLKKPNYIVSEKEAEKIRIISNDLQKYVSRGGSKLEMAMKKLAISCASKNVLDVGQSTGGFTDFLVQNSAAKVVGIDVGHNQLHEKMRKHPDVTFFEGLHVKDLKKNDEFLQSVPQGGFDIIVMDVSFISITKVMLYLKEFLKKNGEYLFLVKPQFELTAQDLDRNGIVKNPKSYARVQINIEQEASLQFGNVISYIACDLSGKDGNQEFFIYGKNV